MNYLWSAFLGFVQGVAEFLPISSSGHLSLLQNLDVYKRQGHLLGQLDVKPLALCLGVLLAELVAQHLSLIHICGHHRRSAVR